MLKSRRTRCILILRKIAKFVICSVDCFQIPYLLLVSLWETETFHFTTLVSSYVLVTLKHVKNYSTLYPIAIYDASLLINSRWKHVNMMSGFPLMMTGQQTNDEISYHTSLSTVNLCVPWISVFQCTDIINRADDT